MVFRAVADKVKKLKKRRTKDADVNEALDAYSNGKSTTPSANTSSKLGLKKVAKIFHVARSTLASGKTRSVN